MADGIQLSLNYKSHLPITIRRGFQEQRLGKRKSKIKPDDVLNEVQHTLDHALISGVRQGCLHPFQVAGIAPAKHEDHFPQVGIVGDWIESIESELTVRRGRDLASKDHHDIEIRQRNSPFFNTEPTMT